MLLFLNQRKILLHSKYKKILWLPLEIAEKLADERYALRIYTGNVGRGNNGRYHGRRTHYFRSDVVTSSREPWLYAIDASIVLTPLTSKLKVNKPIKKQLTG